MDDSCIVGEPVSIISYGDHQPHYKTVSNWMDAAGTDYDVRDWLKTNPAGKDRGLRADKSNKAQVIIIRVPYNVSENNHT